MNIDQSILEKVKTTAYKHAVLNAVKHEGRADLKAVLNKIAGEVPEIRRYMREIINVVKEVVEEVNKLPLEEQLKIARENWPELVEVRPREYRKELPPLPNAIEGRVVTRLAPNPDFSLHLGNARPALLSYWYAKMYRGKMILRFEDTDPRTKSPYPDTYESIKKDLRWLGVSWDEEYIQSLRLPLFYEVTRELIRRRGVYIDLCDNKTFKVLRNMGKACPHRDRSIEDQLEEFDKMLSGYYGEGEAVVRVKTDLQHPDISIRDWVALRIIDTSRTPHPVTGEKYIVWPTYNFAAAVDDHLMGVTHILRAKEHVTNTIKQRYLYSHMDWVYPETIHFGRLSLEGVILSKSKTKKLIVEKGIDSYADPRLGTIQGLSRRGIVKETIWEIIRDVGVKGIDAKISLVNLYAINRAIIDPRANRYMAVEKPVRLVLKNIREELKASIPIHPSRREYYSYTIHEDSVVYISLGDFKTVRSSVFRLMGLANFTIEGPGEVEGEPVYIARLHSIEQEFARKQDIPIIQWVLEKENTKGLLIKPIGLELQEIPILIEKRVIGERVDSIIQLYRIGFTRVDRVGPDHLVLIYAHD